MKLSKYIVIISSLLLTDPTAAISLQQGSVASLNLYDDSKVMQSVKERTAAELGKIRAELSDPKKLKAMPAGIAKLKADLLERAKPVVPFIENEESGGGADSPRIAQAQEILEQVKAIRAQEASVKQEQREKIIGQIEKVEKSIEKNERIIRAKEQKENVHKVIRSLGKQISESGTISKEKTKREIKAIGKALETANKMEEEQQKNDLKKKDKNKEGEGKDGDKKKEGGGKDKEKDEKKEGAKDEKKEGGKDEKKEGSGKDEKKAGDGKDDKKDGGAPPAVQGGFVRLDDKGQPTCRIAPEDLKKYTKDGPILLEPEQKK